MLLIVPSIVLAEDLLVVCAWGGDCNMSPDNEPLFDENDLKPGDNYEQNFEVRNERSEACALTFDVDETEQEPNNFAQRLFTVVKEGSKNWYGLAGGSGTAADDKNLDELYGADPTDLGIIESDSTRNFKWIVTFDREAGNEYQKAETKFDFDLSFECEVLPSEGRILGMNGGLPGAIAGSLLSRFPATGRNGEAVWLAKDSADWTRVMSGILAVVLGLYLIYKTVWKKIVRDV
jgi:hypothetical protein